MGSPPLRADLADVAHRLKRNKALSGIEGRYVAAVNGHEFFSSRKRCCLAMPDPHAHHRWPAGDRGPSPGGGLPSGRRGSGLALDVELLRPGEGEQTAALRLLERVFTAYPRFFDVVVADALYFDAPFINFCIDRNKHVIVTAKGDHRLLVQDAKGLFAHQPPGRWVDEKDKRTVHFWTRRASPPARG